MNRFEDLEAFVAVVEAGSFTQAADRLGIAKSAISRRVAGLAVGALRGDPRTAFRVRCDRSTMSQNDLDAGRLIAWVQFDAALPIDRIDVVLELEDGGRVSLAGPGAPGREAA